MMHFRLALIALLATATLGACGKKNDTPKTGSDSAATSATTSTATSDNADAASVESIAIARDDGSGKAGEETETLKPEDKMFHGIVHMSKMGSGAKVKVDLIAVDTPEGKNISVLSQDYTLGGIENQVDVKFSLPNPWPTGTYRVDAYVDGKLSKSKEFKIEA
jgi:hypothetical protein